MSNWPFVKLERTRLKNHAVLAENWIHDRIAEDPEILGLGTLTISRRESFGNGLEQFVATRAGSDANLSLLVQCGSTDEAQLVRAIESWSNAASTNGGGSTAVLVSEEIGKRYLDLIPVLSGAGRLTAIKMDALQIGQQMTVVFTPVAGALGTPAPEPASDVAETLETPAAIAETPVPPVAQATAAEAVSAEAETVLGDIESAPSSEAPSVPMEIPVPTEFAAIPELPSVDRAYWERSAPAGVEMADRLLAITQAIDPSIELTYRPSYMGLARQGGSNDFAKFTPEESGLLLGLSLEPNSLIELSIAQAGLERLQDENEGEGYRIRLAAANIDAQRAPVARLIQLAYEESRA